MADPVFDPEFAPPPAVKPDDPVGRAFAWLKAHEAGVVMSAAGFQVLVLASLVLSASLPTRGAPTVLLRVVPVDPRDLMRGDYVILGYEIGRPPPGSFSPGQTVYVSLVPEQDGRHYGPGAVTAEPPGGGVRYIRGTVEPSRRISFGIESYFVQEGKGHDYERGIFEHRLSAEVALAADGRAQLRRLVFD